MNPESAAPAYQVITNAIIATFAETKSPLGFGLIKDAALAIADDQVIWVGKKTEIPASCSGFPSWSAGGRLITPGLVECHSNLLFGGDRRHGNFHDIVKATRESGDEDLLAGLRRRASWFARQGVSTIEIKTGYGVTPDEQMRLLAVIQDFSSQTNLHVRRTLLAGSVYPEMLTPEDFIESFVVDLVGRAHSAGLMDSVDVYCDDEGGMSLDDSSTLLEAAYKKKIPTRLQTDRHSDSAGAVLAASFYARAAAYLNYTDETGLETLAKIGTVAVLMPGAFLEDKEIQKPAIERMRELGISMAISTGFEPGSSPLASPLVAAHLACKFFGLTPVEALHGLTTMATKALGEDAHTGTLIAGARADLAVWDAEHPEDLVYWYGAPLCHKLLVAGAELRL